MPAQITVTGMFLASAASVKAASGPGPPNEIKASALRIAHNARAVPYRLLGYADSRHRSERSFMRFAR